MRPVRHSAFSIVFACKTGPLYLLPLPGVGYRNLMKKSAKQSTSAIMAKANAKVNQCFQGNQSNPERRVGEKIDEETKQAIANAVHNAITSVTGTDGVSLCAFYALAGMALCDMYFGGIHFPQAGSLFVRTSDDVDEDGNVQSFAYHPKNEAERGRMYHAWFIRKETPHSQPQIIDLTARLYPLVAQINGHKWERETRPDYLWGEKIPEGYVFLPDPGMCQDPTNMRMWTYTEAEKICFKQILQHAIAEISLLGFTPIKPSAI